MAFFRIESVSMKVYFYSLLRRKGEKKVGRRGHLPSLNHILPDRYYTRYLKWVTP